jgi:hypothetical protein
MNTINDSNMYLELKLTPKPKKITLDPVTGAVLTDQTYASRELVCQLFGMVTNVCTFRNGVCYFEMQH